MSTLVQRKCFRPKEDHFFVLITYATTSKFLKFRLPDNKNHNFLPSYIEKYIQIKVDGEDGVVVLWMQCAQKRHICLFSTVTISNLRSSTLYQQNDKKHKLRKNTILFLWKSVQYSFNYFFRCTARNLSKGICVHVSHCLSKSVTWSEFRYKNGIATFILTDAHSMRVPWG